MSHPLSYSRPQFLGYAGASFAFTSDLARGAEAESGFTQTRAKMALFIRGVLTSAHVPSLAYAPIQPNGIIPLSLA